MHKTGAFFFLFFFGWIFQSLGQMVPGFYPNNGQWEKHVLYTAPVKGGYVFITDTALVFEIQKMEHTHGPEESFFAFRYKQFFEGGNFQGIVEGKPGGHPTHFLLGNDSTKWAQDVPHFSKLQVNEFIEGVDLFLTIQNGQFKTDWVERVPGALDKLKWSYYGISPPTVSDKGLVFRKDSISWAEKIPGAFTWENHVETTPLPCQYTKNGNWYSFNSHNQDGACKWIDPELIFGTFSGSVSNNFGSTACFDLDGFLYAGSITFGPIYPFKDPFDDTFNNVDDRRQTDIAITKYDSTGTLLVYSTLIGGNSGEFPHSIITNDKDELFVLASTGSTDIPLTPNAFQQALVPSGPQSYNSVRYSNGTDIWVFGLSAAGNSLLGSTYLGGSKYDGPVFNSSFSENYADEFRGEIELDEFGNVVIGATTSSGDFPTTSNAYQKDHPNPELSGQYGIVSKLPVTMDKLLASSYVYGNNSNTLFSIEISPDGTVYIAGGTNSTDLIPEEVGGFQKQQREGEVDGYVMALDNTLSTCVAGTYFGGTNYDQVYFVDLSRENEVFICGQTLNFTSPLFNANNLFNTTYPKGSLFVAQLSEDLKSLQRSYTIGDNSPQLQLSPTAFLIDNCYNAYIGGWGGNTNQGAGIRPKGFTTNLPVTSDAYRATSDGSDFYLFAANKDGSDLMYGSFFGGVQAFDRGVQGEHVDGGTNRLDPRGVLYQTICGACFESPGNVNYPIFPDNAWSTNKGSGRDSCNSYVFKFDYDLQILVVDFSIEPIHCLNGLFTPTNNTSLGIDFEWDLGNGITSSEFEPQFFYPSAGEYTITLSSLNQNTCNGVDAVSKTVLVVDQDEISLDTIFACLGDTVAIGTNLPVYSGVQYEWTLAPSPLLEPTLPLTSVKAVENGLFELKLTTSQGCIKYYQYRILTDFATSFPDTLIVCDPQNPLILNPHVPAKVDYYRWFSNDITNPPLSEGAVDSTYQTFVTETENFILEYTVGSCIYHDTVLVIPSNIEHELIGDTVICKGDTVTLVSKGDHITRQWVFNPTILSTALDKDSIVAVVSQNQSYIVILTDTLGCSLTESIEIRASTLKESEYSLDHIPVPIPKRMTTVEVEVIPYFNSPIDWDPGIYFEDSTVNPAYFVNPKLQDTIPISARLSDGQCFQDVEGELIFTNSLCGPPNLFVPNAFSPNGDGNNDWAMVEGRSIAQMLWEIFDRWGNLIFRSEDQSQGWDGKFNGKLVDPGVYVYQIEVLCVEGDTWTEKGNITVLR